MLLETNGEGKCALQAKNSNLVHCSFDLIQVSVSGFNRYHCVKWLSL